MASIRREIAIEASPEEVWSALRDWDALHERLVPGFVVDTRREGDDLRIVTFGSGAVLRERIIAVDDEARRIAWTVIDGPYAHHSASAQVFDEGGGRSRFVWIADLLPDSLAGSTGEAMAEGTGIVKKTLETR
ncbi:SRPBCC family protein [Amycolatopsis cynarae]|uniref:SRPBCC family protein n=1 Tax=Amycolatopsis cynarae TaxID=2995223 RepID=A0ABY7AV48_9PSEU|nr:SRPBCC family protein [Amycolatopsis sp. HUAS 11-8]WAL63857.1 SRPBCC family protein [Amycolatopsis sp. HUAS 11-8]